MGWLSDRWDDVKDSASNRLDEGKSLRDLLNPVRKPSNEFFKDKFMKGSTQGKEGERDLVQREQDMQDYVEFGPQEGRPTFSLAELKAGPAGSMNAGNPGDAYGQTAASFDASDPESNPDRVYQRDVVGLDDKYWEGVDIGDDSWLRGQMSGTQNPVVQNKMQQQNMPARTGGADFSMVNPFANVAKSIGLSDFQNYNNQIRPGMAQQPGSQQQAQAAALRGSK